jgi:hypothetical protein
MGDEVTPITYYTNNAGNIKNLAHTINHKLYIKNHTLAFETPKGIMLVMIFLFNPISIVSILVTGSKSWGCIICFFMIFKPALKQSSLVMIDKAIRYDSSYQVVLMLVKYCWRRLG